jgi:hypothetical protein
MRRILLGLVIGSMGWLNPVGAEDTAPPIEVHFMQFDQLIILDCYPAQSGETYGAHVYMNTPDGLASYGCTGNPPVWITVVPSRPLKVVRY